MGIIVPKHRHSAVDRNTLKRRLREIARVDMLPALPPSDLVIRARREAYDASFDALRTELARVVTRASELLLEAH